MNSGGDVPGGTVAANFKSDTQATTSEIVVEVAGDRQLHQLVVPDASNQMLVQDVRGEVVVIRVNGEQSLLRSGDVLEIGDVVLADNRGGFDVVTHDGANITFASNSRLVVEPVAANPSAAARFFVIQGEFVLQPGNSGGNATTEIRTPVATLSSRGGRMVGRAALEAQSNSFVLLPDASGAVGVVSVTTAAGVIVLEKAFAGAEVLSTVRAPVPFDQEGAEQVLSEFGQDILSQIGTVAGRTPTPDDGIFNSLKNLLGLGDGQPTGPVASTETGISGGGDDSTVTGQVEDDALIEASNDAFRLDFGDNNNVVAKTIDIPAEGEILVVGGGGQNDILTLVGRDDVVNSGNIRADGGDVVVDFDNGGAVRLREFEELALNLGSESESIVIGDLSQTDIADNTVIVESGAGDDLVNATATARSLVLDGGAGGDTLFASSSDDTLLGGTGDDVLRGGGTNDVGDQLFGGEGNDTLDGGAGDDLIDGGTGTDNLEFASATAGVNVNLQQGTATGQGADTLVSIENVTGTAANDTLAGNADDNSLLAAGGDDQLAYTLGAGNDTLGGGAGADSLDVALAGGENTAVVSAQGTEIRISSGQAGDPVAQVSGVENIVVTGTDAGESVTVQDLTGTEIAASGITVNAGGGNDTLDAGALTSGASLSGGAGDDSLRGGAGDDTLDGGAGTDSADFTATNGDVVVDLAAGTVTGHGSDQISGVENIVTGSGADQITANATADNNLSSGGGNDTLIAAGGNDTFQGGAGSDLLDFTAIATGADLRLDNGTYSIGSNSGSVSGIEAVNGTTGNDSVVGSAGDETLAGGEGNDNIDAGAGDDQLVLNVRDNGLDQLNGGAGDDVLLAEGADGVGFVLGISADSGNLVVDTSDQSGQATAGQAVVEGVESVSLTGASGDDVFNISDFSGATGLGAGGIVLNGGTGSNAVVLNSNGTNATIDLSNIANQNTGLGTLTIRNVQNVVAGDGADTLTGNDVANVLRGAAGNDSLIGGNGDDTLVGGTGNDVLDGGVGTDVADYSETSAQVDQVFDLRVNTFTIVDQGTDTLNSIEGVIAGGGNDTLIGTNDRNVLDGGAGNDSLNGDNGNDLLRDAAGDDTLDGGAGIDELDVSAATASGGSSVGVTVDLINGVATGGGLGNNTISGIEQVTGSALDDVITGSVNNDTLNGADGNDQLFGGLGADSIIGGFGNDTLAGGDGNDTLFGEQGSDRLSGDGGDDQLDGGTGDDTLFGGAGNDTLNGQAGSDSLFGGDGNDVLSVTFGKNTLDGGSGDDVISGKDNQDTLIGGLGSDTLTGEGGADRFEFNSGDAGDSGIDRITDFEVGSDKIKIAAADFGNLASNNGQLVDGTSFVSVGALGDNLGTQQATFVFDRSNNNLHFDPDGDGQAASFEIATVQFSSGSALQATDFQVG